MEVTYRRGDCVPNMRPRSFVTPKALIGYLSALSYAAAEWLKAGPALALGSLAVGIVGLVLLRLRLMKLCVVANDQGIAVVGWLSKSRWDWYTIAGIDYVPKRVRLAGTFYTGRVTLTNGDVAFISALSGSAAGTKAADDRHRTFIAEVSRELDRRRDRIAVAI